MTYRPRRSRARWLEGAPAALLAVYDNGGKSFDRYTAIYGAPLWEPSYGTRLPARAMSHTRKRFLDLPLAVRRCIERDCADDS